MLTFAVASLILLSPQRSESEIQWRRKTNNVFTPSMERMMRATDRQLLVFAGSVKIDERGSALGEIQSRNLASAAPTLIKYLDPQVGTNKELKLHLQTLTIYTLGKLGNKVAIPPLRKYLNGKELRLRLSSGFALADLDDGGSMAGFRALFPYLKDPMMTPFIRKFAKFRDKDSEPLLRGLLTRRTQSTRAVAAEALGSVGNQEKTVPALIKLLKDDYPNVRAKAATSLAQLKARQAVPALQEALKDTSPQASNAPKMERESKESIQEALRALQAG